MTAKHARLAGALIMVGVSFAWISEARAEILLAQTNNNATRITGGGATLLPLAFGQTSMTFTTTAANTRVMIVFNAACALSGYDDRRSIDVDVLVDEYGPRGEIRVAPSEGNSGFCSDFGFSYGDLYNSLPKGGWQRPSMVATMVLFQAGTHTIKIRVNDPRYGEYAWLDDWSLTVLR